MTFIPGLFYIFITASFILNSSIGFNLNYKVSEITALIVTIISAAAVYKCRMQKYKEPEEVINIDEFTCKK